MSISSVSRVYDAPDPIMETDLELLAKVNTFQQSKFDIGAATLQNEINNWAMMADVAKPQDREYINAKLNNLVNRVNSLGGVDLSDVNNVNSIKSLGYNIYGDQRILNAVSTTKKYKSLLADGSAKLNGKNAKDYDPVYFQYLQDKWNNWLNDGQVGSSYEGPQQLMMGSFENYQKRINEEISKLQPDIESLPQGSAEALNYIQVNNKFIKKERVKQLVESLTTAQDREIINAHAWRNMGGVDDKTLVDLSGSAFDYQIKQLQKQKNDIKHWSEQSTDHEQKRMYADQMDQLDVAINNAMSQKNQLMSEASRGLKPELKEALRGNLYFDAYKEGLASSKAFQQNTSQIKSNEARMFQLKEARQAYEFAETMKWNMEKFEKESELKLFELGLKSNDGSSLSGMGIYGPASTAPLSIVDVRGEADASVISGKTIESANTNYAAASSNFYSEAYNKLGSLPGYQNYVTRNEQGIYVPKDEQSKRILDQAIENKVASFDDIANIPIDKREKYEENLTQDDKELMRLYTNVKEADLYRRQMQEVENMAFEKSGLVPPSRQIISLPLNDGRTVKVSVSEFKRIKDTAEKNPNSKEAKTYAEWQRLAKDSGYRSDGSFMGDVKEVFKTDLDPNRALGKTTYLDGAIDFTENYYEKVDWSKVSKTISPYGRNVTLPKNSKGKVNETAQAYLATSLRNQLPNVAKSVKQEDVDITRVYVKFDGNNENSKARYMADVVYEKGKKAGEGDKVATIDLTEDVLANPNSFVANLYPKDNAEIIYGFTLSKNGMTPLSASDNYSSALSTTSYAPYSTKFQIVSQKNQKDGIETFRVNMLIPYTKSDGTIGYNVVPVKNTYNNFSLDFPPNFKSVNDYMNQKFSSKEKALEFYNIHGINTK